MTMKMICAERTPPNLTNLPKKLIKYANQKVRGWRNHKSFTFPDVSLYDFYNNPHVHRRIKEKLINLYHPSAGEYSVQIVSPYRMTKALDLTLTEEEMRIRRPRN